MPTKEEFEELIECCTWNWTTYKGVNGYKVTGPNGNSIFLPATDSFGASLYDRGTTCDYWSAMPYESYSVGAYCLYFTSGYFNTYWGRRNYGLSVRPVSD